MNSYLIMRIEKRQLGAVTKICNHHERLKERYKSNPDIVAERTSKNYHLKQPEDKYRTMALKMIEEAGAKRRSNSVILQDALVTASPEWINGLPDDKQVEFFEQGYKYFADTFGEKNIISAVVHMDETNPHMHLCFVPLTKDNRLSSKELIGGPRGMRKHQDNFYAHMSEKFSELMRGLPKEVTHRKHIPTEFYKNAAMLMEHFEEITQAINDIGMMNASKKKDKAIELLGMYAPEMANMKSQMKMTNQHIQRLESALSDAKHLNAKKGDIIYDQQNEIAKLKDDLNELNWKQRKLYKVIEKIPPEVMEQMKKSEAARRREMDER